MSAVWQGENVNKAHHQHNTYGKTFVHRGNWHHYDRHHDKAIPLNQSAGKGALSQHNPHLKGGKGKSPNAMTQAYFKGKAQGLFMTDGNASFVDLPVKPAVPTLSRKLSENSAPMWKVKEDDSVTEDEILRRTSNKMFSSMDEKEGSLSTYDDMGPSVNSWDSLATVSSDRYPLTVMSSVKDPSPRVSSLMAESLHCIITSLYRDRIKPTTKVVKEILMERYPTPTEDHQTLLDNFPSICVARSDEYRVEYRANDSIFYLKSDPAWFEGWVQLEGIVEDEYGDVFWIRFSNYVDNLKTPVPYMEAARVGDRAEEINLAKELRGQCLHFMQHMSLGELCAVVRLARSKGLLVFRGDVDRLHEV